MVVAAYYAVCIFVGMSLASARHEGHQYDLSAENELLRQGINCPRHDGEKGVAYNEVHS